jgi:biopolymer transport protein ExbD
MAGATFDNDDEVMGEINMIPFIDIMLVLLIVFIITVPVMKHAVSVELPKAANEQAETKPETIQLSVKADGSYFWDDLPVTDAELETKLQAAAALPKIPDLHIRGDKDVRYERVAQAMAAAQHAGLKKIGFITDPKEP